MRQNCFKSLFSSHLADAPGVHVLVSILGIYVEPGDRNIVVSQKSHYIIDT